MSATTHPSVQPPSGRKVPDGLRPLLLPLLWVALALAFAVQFVASGLGDWSTALRLGALDWGPWIVLAPPILWLSRRVPVDPRTWRWAVPVHIVAIVLAMAAMEMTTRAVFRSGLIHLPRIFANTPPQTNLPGPNDVSVGPPPLLAYARARIFVPIYLVLMAAAHAAAYQRSSIERERAALAAENRLVEARLLALQTQLQPHFLFNALNSISTLIYESPKAADEMLCALSSLLRGVLEASDRRELTLDEELEFAERYFAIQRIRFSDRLQVQCDVPDALGNALVPTLILQPLVENAIVHGIAPHARRGLVAIRAWQEGPRLVITIVDSGTGEGCANRASGTPLVLKEHVGLANTRSRLAALHGIDFHLSLSRTPEGGVCARVELPLHEAIA